MASVYVDTNVYLDFYRHANHPLSVFQDLKKLGKRLLMPEQTIAEFERNRSEAIATALVQLAEVKVAWTAPPDMIGGLPEFAELSDARKRVNQLVDQIKRKIEKYAQDDASDDVLLAFRALTESARMLPTSGEIIQRAQHRKLLGNPPYSRGKHTIGDEVIWETLLDGCKEDLLLCTRDGTFLVHEPYLRAEYQRRGERKLTVTRELSAAQKSAGEDDTTIKIEETVVAEKRNEAARARQEAITDASRALNRVYGQGVSDAFRTYMGESAGAGVRRDFEYDGLSRAARLAREAMGDLGHLSAMDKISREAMGDLGHLNAIDKLGREAMGDLGHLNAIDKISREAMGDLGHLNAIDKLGREAMGDLGHLNAIDKLGREAMGDLGHLSAIDKLSREAMGDLGHLSAIDKLGREAMGDLGHLSAIDKLGREAMGDLGHLSAIDKLGREAMGDLGHLSAIDKLSREAMGDLGHLTQLDRTLRTAEGLDHLGDARRMQREARALPSGLDAPLSSFDQTHAGPPATAPSTSHPTLGAQASADSERSEQPTAIDKDDSDPNKPK